MVLKQKSAAKLMTALFATILFGVLFPSVTSLSYASPSSQPTATALSTSVASSLWVVVDKRLPLNPINYAPSTLTKPKFVAGAGQNRLNLVLAKPAALAVVGLASAMQAAGAGTLTLESTYRSYQDQVAIHAKDVAKFGLVAGENLAARPGYSEHQTGLAMDVSAVGQEQCRIRVCFASTTAGKWLAQNAYKFGFILRYPDGKTAVTGYQFEPWHFRYVGTELSTQMRQSGTTVLETYFGLPAAPSY